MTQCGMDVRPCIRLVSGCSQIESDARGPAKGYACIGIESAYNLLKWGSDHNMLEDMGGLVMLAFR